MKVTSGQLSVLVIMRLILVLTLVTLACAKKRYDGYQVLSLNPTNDEHTGVIRALHDHFDLDFWTESDLMVPAGRLNFVHQMLDRVGLEYSVHTQNVQQLIDEAEELVQERSEDLFYDLNNFNTYDQIVDAITDMEANCPSGFTCSLDSFGSSYNGRDIPALVIRSGNKPMVYLDSLIHAREWLAGATVLKIADRLINGDDAEAQRMRDSYNWYIAPVINPDGYSYTWTNERLWRKNRQPNTNSGCMGTDLNRNFDAAWGYSGTSTNPCSDTYGGSAPASGVETKLVQDKFNSLSNELFGVISYHAYAKMWLHAYGYTTVPGGFTCATSSSYGQINAVALAARNAVQRSGGQSWTYGPVCSVIYPASGSTVDYVHDVSGCVYAYTPELRGNSFIVSATEIEPSYLEQWAGLVAMVDTIALQ